VWLQEMAQRVSHAAVIFVDGLSSPSTLETTVTKERYLSVVNAWWRKYRNMSPQAKP
jgi:hypothetical protein